MAARVASSSCGPARGAADKAGGDGRPLKPFFPVTIGRVGLGPALLLCGDAESVCGPDCRGIGAIVGCPRDNLTFQTRIAALAAPNPDRILTERRNDAIFATWSFRDEATRATGKGGRGRGTRCSDRRPPA